jgi:pimeloyl-ACP methyl ester carboxylesterase
VIGVAPTIESWWAQGETVTIDLGGGPRRIFMRRAGSGPHVTLLHGFPSSSHDWAAVAGELEAERELLLADFLGFGASEKPPEHTYSIHEQTDLIEALWRAQGVRQTDLVAHDYGVSVAQELLARRGEGRHEVELASVTLLNGGIYPDLHRPQPGQVALLDPVNGPKLGALMSEELFVASLAPTFAPTFDSAAESAQIWRSMERDGGALIAHRLIGYVRDRERHAERWVGALENGDVPLAFVWGMLDPVSGAHMAARIRERLPDAPLTKLADVGHWPMLEAPARVTRALLGRST